MIELTCFACGACFRRYPSLAPKGDRAFCSQKCWVASQPPKLRVCCTGCGKEFPKHRSRYRGVRQFCSFACKRAHKFPGSLNGDRYRTIAVDGRRVLEHRFVVERHLGRKLTRSEVVHHIDGDRTNNAIENESTTSTASMNIASSSARTRLA